MTLPDYVSQSEFARRAGKNRKTIQRAIEDGRLSVMTPENSTGSVVMDGVRVLGIRPYAGARELGVASLDESPELTLRPGRRERPAPDSESFEVDDIPDELLEDDDDDLPESLADAKRRKESAQANLAELNLETRSGALVPVEQVRKDATDCAVLVREAFLTLAAKVAPMLVGLSEIEAARKVLDEAIRDTLGALQMEDG